jgi:Cu/Ag efflux protein CusF
MKLSLPFGLFILLATGLAANAAHHPQHAPTEMPSAAAASDGEVRKVDKSAGKVTIKHGPLANLYMPAMTMVFRVKDSTMLDRVNPGDKVKFVAEKIDGAYTVTHIELAN